MSRNTVYIITEDNEPLIVDCLSTYLDGLAGDGYETLPSYIRYAVYITPAPHSSLASYSEDDLQDMLNESVKEVNEMTAHNDSLRGYR